MGGGRGSHGPDDGETGSQCEVVRSLDFFLSTEGNYWILSQAMFISEGNKSVKIVSG